MANLNIRVDDHIKQQAFLAFDNLGLTPSEAIRAFLSYVASTGRMPIKQVLLSDEDLERYAIEYKEEMDRVLLPRVNSLASTTIKSGMSRDEIRKTLLG